MATLFFWKLKNPAACWHRPGSAISKTGLVFDAAKKMDCVAALEQTYIHTHTHTRLFYYYRLRAKAGARWAPLLLAPAEGFRAGGP